MKYLLPIIFLTSCTSEITKIPGDVAPYAESSPVINGKPVIFVSTKPDLQVFDFESGELIKSIDFSYDFASAVNVPQGIMVTGSRDNFIGWEILDYSYNILEKGELQLPQKVFNTSILYNGEYVLAYEISDTPGRYAIRFSASPDMKNWRAIGSRFPKTKGYAAAPSLKFKDGLYTLYYTYVEKIKPVNGLEYGFNTYKVTSKDLNDFSRARVFLSPSQGEGVNNSDFDSVEFEGRTYVTYNVGDQKTVGHIRRASY